MHAAMQLTSCICVFVRRDLNLFRTDVGKKVTFFFGLHREHTEIIILEFVFLCCALIVSFKTLFGDRPHDHKDGGGWQNVIL